jgi:uncharacterized protein
MMCNEKCYGGCLGYKIGKILLIVGGLNWGLVGIGMLMNSNWNVIDLIFGSLPIVEAVIYVLVGLAAVMKIFGCCCKECREARGACCAGEDMEKKM